MYRYYKRLIIIFLAFVMSPSSWSNLPETTPPEFGKISFKILNDMIFETDKDYTNGVKLTWTPKNSHFTFRLGQDMYTPTDLSAEEPVEGEHPYAGWAYFGLQYKKQLGKDFIYDFTFDIGTTGKRSGAEDTQKFIHDFFNGRHPNGWDTQVFEEFGYVPQLQLNYRIPFLSISTKLIELRTQPYIRARSGDVLKDYGIGANLLLGKNIPAYSPKIVLPNKNIYLYMRANFERILVEENIFLEGNSKEINGETIFSYGVIPEDYISTAKAGIFLGLAGYEIGLDVNYTSVTYTTQVIDTSGASRFVDREVPDGDYIMALIIKKYY